MKTTTRLGIIHKVDLYKRIINKYRIRDYLLCKKANSGTITVGVGTIQANCRLLSCTASHHKHCCRITEIPNTTNYLV